MTEKGPLNFRVKLPPGHQVYPRWRLHTVSFNAERQAGKLRIPIFIVFGLTRLGIEPESTVSVADAVSNRLLIGYSFAVLAELVLHIFSLHSTKIRKV